MSAGGPIGILPFGAIPGAGSGGGGGGGTDQKQPQSFRVGTTSGAPSAGSNTWTKAAFANSYIQLFIGGALIPDVNPGNGSPYITKALASDTMAITNYLFQEDDIISYTLITPTP